MEGMFYYVYCEFQDGVYKLYLKDNPQIQSNENKFEIAKESLLTQIINWNGDGEAKLEFLSKDDRSWYLCRGEYEFPLDSSINYFTGGVCSSCSFPVGDRNENQLRLLKKPCGGVVHVPAPIQSIQLYRKSLVDKLSAFSDVKLEFREALLEGVGSGYYELMSLPSCQYVLKNGIEVNEAYRSTFHCVECGRKSFQGKHPFNEFYFARKEIESIIEIVQPSALVKAAIVINGSLFNNDFNRNKAERFLTKKIELLDEGSYYMPKISKEVHFIDWDV